MTPEEIKAQKEQELADKKAAEEQAKADEKAAKEAEKASKEAGGIVKHAKHEHKPGKYSLKDVVSFECKYPDGYKGKKHLKEGTHKIHRLTAERLQTKKVGKILG